MNSASLNLGRKRPYVVGLGHQARQGKDTFASYMLYHDPQEIRIYHFADALKAHCRVWYKMKGKDSRLLQDIGHAYRQKDPDFWINILKYQIDEEKPAIAIIADVRYVNEANWIRSNGGMLIKIKRMVSSKKQLLATDREMNHPSETELSNFDWDMVLSFRDGDLTSVNDHAREIVRKILR